MEFILHLPQDIDKNGDLWQMWSSFCQNLKFFQIVEFQESSFESSLLLFAAQDQLSSLSASLQMFDLDLPKLNQLLQVVEQACLPYLILLFERFKYFCLKPEPSDSLDDFAIILRKQIEYCEFGNLKDSMMTNALNSLIKRESLVQHLSSTEGLRFDDITVKNIEVQTSHTDTNNIDTDTNINVASHIESGNDSISQKEDESKLAKKINALTTQKNVNDTKQTKVEKRHLEDEDSDLENVEENNILASTDTGRKADFRKNSSGTELSMDLTLTKFNCCFCERSFSGQLCFRKHLVLKHKGSKEFQCKMCANKFVNVDEYLMHYNTEHIVKEPKSKGVASKTPKVKSVEKKSSNSSLKAGKLTKQLNTLKTKMKAKEVKGFKKHKQFGNRTILDSTSTKKGTILSQICAETNTDKDINSSIVKIEGEETKSITLTKFHCCFCDRSFVGQLCLRKHLAFKHNDGTKFKCKMCSDEFGTVDEYLLHNNDEHFVKQQNSTLPSLQTKIRRRDIRKCCCEVCRGGFIKEGCLKHILDYNTNSFMCWECGENFQSLLEYKRHSEKHDLITKFSCDLCQMQHRNIFRLIGHLRKHFVPQNKCEICGVAFIKQESLAKHMILHAAIPAHVCEICGKSFVTEARLQSHMKVHSGEKRFTCELCGKMYCNKNNLRDHKRWHAGEKPFICDICGKRTRSSGDMSKHKRKHLNKRAYVCEVCGRGFNYNHTLVRHRLGHSGKRSYACKVCGRTFIYKEGLMDHIKAQRCPGRQSESGYKRTPKATKLIKTDISADLIDVVESEIYIPTHVQRTVDGTLKETQDWLCVLNNETEVATNILVVSSLY